MGSCGWGTSLHPALCDREVSSRAVFNGHCVAKGNVDKYFIGCVALRSFRTNLLIAHFDGVDVVLYGEHWLNAPITFSECCRMIRMSGWSFSILYAKSGWGFLILHAM